MTTPEELGIQAETLELIKDEVEGRFIRQLDSLNAIDTKAGLVVGYALTAAAFLATRDAQPVLAGLAYGAYAVAAGYGVAALAVRYYQDVGVRALLNLHAKQSKTAALMTVTANQIKQVEFNNGILQRKAWQWWISLLALMLATLLLVAAIVVQTHHHDQQQLAREQAVSVAIAQYGPGHGGHIPGYRA